MGEVSDVDEVERARCRLAVVRRIADLGTWEVDVRTDEVRWCTNMHRILGVPESTQPDIELFLAAVHRDDLARLVQVHAEALDGASSYPVEHRVVRPDGSVRHVRQDAVTQIEDGQVVRLLGTMQDITDRLALTRNLVETESRRRELLHRLVRASEHERAALAGDLHDGPIQMLTVAAMRLEHLGMIDPSPPEWLPDAVQTVRDTVVQLRDVLVELHPRAGAGAGLDATLTQLALTIVPDLDVEVAVRGDTTEGEERAVFGIVQDALWDVREGDRARHLDIHVDARGAELELTLVGGSERSGTSGGLLGPAGLLGVRERSEGLGGRCSTEHEDGDPVVRCVLPRTDGKVARA